MTHALSIVLCLAAFAALAAATHRVQSDLLGRELPTGASRGLRAGGWALLLASLAIVIGAQGWGLGLVSYSGHTSVAAGVVYLALIALARQKQVQKQSQKQRQKQVQRQRR